MSIFDSMEISSSGLYAQKTRMNAISSNIANIDTTRTPEGGPYRRQVAVFAALPKANTFADELKAQADGQTPFNEVKVVSVAKDARAFNLKYEPGHPDANAEGFVAYPNIDITEEMVDLIEARRSFEANIAAFNVSKAMALRSLDIGRA